MSILSIVGSVLSGGVTGLAGTAISRYFDYKNKKADREHEVRMVEVEAKVMEQEWAARSAVAKIEGESAIEVEDSRAFKESLSNEPKRYFTGNPKQFGIIFIILDFIRGCIRPALTVYLCILTTLIYLQITNLGIDSTQTQTILNHIINTILYLTTTVVLWWFGSRQKAPPPIK